MVNAIYLSVLKISVRLPLVLLLLVHLSLSAQDAYFSQYYQAPLFLNPAFIGMEKNIYAGINYRSQWKALDNPYVTTQVSIINPVYQKKGREKIHIGGIGLSLVKDVAGENGYLKTYGVMGSGAYNLKLNGDGTNNVSFSLQGGFVYKQISYGDLRWGSQYQSTINNGTAAVGPDYLGQGGKTVPIINTGLLWFYKPEDRFSYYDYTFFAGVSANNLNNPNESLTGISLSRLPLLYKFNAGAELPINRRLHWSPNLLMMTQNGVHQLNGGLYFLYNLLDTPDEYNSIILQAGTWYRLNDSFIFLMGLTLKSLSVNLSYDLNISSLRTYTGGKGAFEVSLSYRIIKERRIMRRSYPF